MTWYRRFAESNPDTIIYRNGYPGLQDVPQHTKNLRFYKGDLKSRPSGDLIDEIHKKWWGNYDLLEEHHGYIQWLFPIREGGLNSQAQELQMHEAKRIMEDDKAKARVLESFKMMLDFYGMELESPETGIVRRSKNWEDRYDNLNMYSHNYLRITRILKCLGELGFEHLKKPWLEFLVEEIIGQGQIRNARDALVRYWMGTLKSGKELRALYGKAEALAQKKGVIIEEGRRRYRVVDDDFEAEAELVDADTPPAKRRPSTRSWSFDLGAIDAASGSSASIPTVVGKKKGKSKKAVAKTAETASAAPVPLFGASSAGGASLDDA